MQIFLYECVNLETDAMDNEVHYVSISEIISK